MRKKKSAAKAKPKAQPKSKPATKPVAKPKAAKAKPKKAPAKAKPKAPKAGPKNKVGRPRLSVATMNVRVSEVFAEVITAIAKRAGTSNVRAADALLEEVAEAHGAPVDLVRTPVYASAPKAKAAKPAKAPKAKRSKPVSLGDEGAPVTYEVPPVPLVEAVPPVDTLTYANASDDGFGTVTHAGIGNADGDSDDDFDDEGDGDLDEND